MIPYINNTDKNSAEVGFENIGWKHSGNTKDEMTKLKYNLANQRGRFPSNVILSHHPECKQIGLKEVQTNSHYPEVDINGYGKNYGGKTEYIKEGKRVKSEVVEEWDCHPDCPIRLMDKQSGITKSAGGKSGHIKAYSGGYKEEHYKGEKPGFGDIGGASRFFYCAKANQSERNIGCYEEGTGSNTYNRKCLKCGKWQRKQGFTDDYTCHCEEPNWEEPTGNTHTTVKPIALMEYLCKLTSTPTGGIVLDPFAGSGTTLIACEEKKL